MRLAFSDENERRSSRGRKDCVGRFRVKRRGARKACVWRRRRSPSASAALRLATPMRYSSGHYVPIEAAAGRLQQHSLPLESRRVSLAAVGGTTLALLSQRSTSSQPAVSRQTLEQRQQPVRRTRRRGALTKTPTSFALVRIAAKTLATSVCEPVAT